MSASCRLAVAVVLFSFLTSCASTGAKSKPAPAEPTTTNEVIRQSLYTLLERCGAIKPPQDLASMGRRKRKVYERLRSHLTDRYVYPDTSLIFSYKPEQDFTGNSMVRLGSYIIRTGDHVGPKTFPPNVSPDVRWLPAAQVFLKEPESDYYNLFVDCGYLVKNSLDAEAGVSSEILNAAVKAALKDSYNTHRAISVGVGLFRNELADAFDRVNRGRPEETDFLPLIDIYDLYKTVDTKKRIDENAEIIGSFKGVMIYETFSQKSSAGIKLQDTVKVSGGVPFLRASTAHAGEWSRNVESEAEAGYFRVIVSPSGFDRIKVPKKEQIETAWAAQPRLPLRIGSDRVQISEFEPGHVDIGIGPIPVEVANGVTVKLLSGENVQKAERDRPPTEAEGNYPWIPVRITANADVYQSTKIPEFSDTEAKVRLELANGLARDYIVPIRIMMKPQPVRAAVRFDPRSIGQHHEWDVKYRVEPSDGYSTTNVIPKGISCRGESLRTFAGSLRLDTQRLENNQFTLPVKWDGTPLDPVTPEYCEAEIEFDLRDKLGTHPRKLRVDLKVPRRQDAAAPIRVSAANVDLSQMLTESITVTGGLTVGKLRESSAPIIERNKIIQDNLPVRFDSEAREFVVPRDLMDKSKVPPKP